MIWPIKSISEHQYRWEQSNQWLYSHLCRFKRRRHHHRCHERSASSTRSYGGKTCALAPITIAQEMREERPLQEFSHSSVSCMASPLQLSHKVSTGYSNAHDITFGMVPLCINTALKMGFPPIMQSFKTDSGVAFSVFIFPIFTQ